MQASQLTDKQSDEKSSVCVLLRWRMKICPNGIFNFVRSALDFSSEKNSLEKV